MRKKTALRTPQQRETSVGEPGGLIDRGENAQDSATAKSALTNRSHRTALKLRATGPAASSACQAASGAPSKKSTTPVRKQYSAPTISSPLCSTRRSRRSDARRGG